MVALNEGPTQVLLVRHVHLGKLHINYLSRLYIGFIYRKPQLRPRSKDKLNGIGLKRTHF